MTANTVAGVRRDERWGERNASVPQRPRRCYPAPVSPADLRADLLAWYDANARDLPWRVRPQARAAGLRADPYRVWLSEVMLQQTTVPHAAPYDPNSKRLMDRTTLHGEEAIA